MRTRSLSSLLVLALCAAPLSARDPDARCNERLLPLVLDVGLPYTEGLRLVEARRFLESILKPQYAAAAECPERTLQVNAAVGSDYQMLDWLGSGAVDMAVVSSLTLHLLQRDGIDLLEVPALPEHPLVPTQKGRLVARDVRDRAERTQPERDLDDFRRALLARARAAASQGATELPPGRRLSTQLVFPSHLDTVGFLVPVAETRRWLQSVLAPSAPGEPQPTAVEKVFWSGFFDHACFHFGWRPDRGPTCNALGGTIDTDHQRNRRRREVPASPPTVEIEVEAAPPPAESAATTDRSFRLVDPQRDHLVIRRDAVDELFGGVGSLPLTAVGPVLGEELAPLFGRPRQADELAQDTPEAAMTPSLESYLRPQRYFGTRTFSFTAEESLRLLAAHEAASGRTGVALVLPGGGVKAAYQSRLIDEAYGRQYLRNDAGGQAVRGRPRLEVRDVIGTSGGALLGYFVAQLRADGPFELSRILWFVKPARGGEDVELDSAAVFGWTDLPRYVSLLAIFLVFSLWLAASSLPSWGWLAPRPTNDPTPPPTSLRAPLLLPMLALLVGTPLLVRRVSGDLGLEHVPEFEGLLYAILLVAAMYVDQTLVAVAQPLPAQAAALRGAKHWLGLGLGLVTLPALARFLPQLEPLLQAKAAASFLYLCLGGLAIVVMLRAVRRRRGELGWGDIAGGVLAFVAATAVAYAFLRSLPTWWLEALDRAPLFFVGLGATLAITMLVRVAKGLHKPAWCGRLAASLNLPFVRWIAKVLAPCAACLLILDLTRPAARVFANATLAELLKANVASKLDAPLGGLAVCIGALFALYGIVLATEASGRFQRIAGDRFADAVLFVLVGLSIAVYVSLALISWWWPDSFTLFELTSDFWKSLGWATFAASALLFAWVYFRAQGGPTTQLVRDALRYLCSRHPNAHLVTRRFVRMLLFAAGCLFWWNLLLAPGLYGNRYADGYFKQTIARFQEKSGVAPEAAGTPAPRLTTNLIAIANELVTHDTRYFLVVPDGEPCTAVRLPPGSGSTWYRYHAATSPAPHPHAEIAACHELDLTTHEGRRTLSSFVFASGSPFPIFPAHRVTAVKGAKPEALVDGGYTNNTPVEAAHHVGADRVLIVNSSHPLPAPASGRGGVAQRTGPLVALGLRLPGFLLDRAQQLDRRGRAELFVVSLSPPPRPDWPFLSDFRGSVVRRMLDAAWEDLSRRIGMVESWGPPRFQLSVPIFAQPEAELTAAVTPAMESGGRATPGDQRAPAPARSR